MSWKDVLYLTPSERRGVVALVGLIILIAFAPSIYQKVKPKEKEVDFSRLEMAYALLQAKKDSLAQITENQQATKYNTNKNYKNNYTYSKSPSKSNNQKTAPSNQESTTQQPAPNSQQPESTTQYLAPSNREPTPPISVSINSATAAQFAQLRGIGPVLSERIIKYRESLGGFYSIEQVAMVYGIEPEVFQSIKPKLVLDAAPIQKINVNTATQKQLSSHPFISVGLAKQIVNYRSKAGNYKTGDDLLKLYFMDEELLAKLQPYLIY